MIVNGYVITVPPHNHRMAAAAQWQRPSHAYKKGRDNHLLCWRERQSHAKGRVDTHTHTQSAAPSLPIILNTNTHMQAVIWFPSKEAHSHTQRDQQMLIKGTYTHTHMHESTHKLFTRPLPQCHHTQESTTFLACALTFTHAHGECG